METKDQSNSDEIPTKNDLMVFWKRLSKEQEPAILSFLEISRSIPVTIKKIGSNIIGIAGITEENVLFCLLLNKYENDETVDQMVQMVLKAGRYRNLESIHANILHSDAKMWSVLKKYGFKVSEKFIDPIGRDVIRFSLQLNVHHRPQILGFRKRISNFIDLALKAKPLQEIRASQWWTRDKLEKVQLKKLKALIYFSYNHVKFYKKKMRRVGVTPYDIRTIEDLDKIPVTTKSEIRSASLSDILSTPFTPKNTVQIFTSGTTGLPLTIYNSYSAYRTNKMLLWDRYHQGGVGFRDKVLEISVYLYSQVPAFKSKDLFQRLGFGRRRVLSVTKSPTELLSIMRKFSPDAITARPSILQMLNKELIESSKDGINPKNLFTTGETLLNQNKHDIERIWGLKVIDWYGSNEFQSIAWECSKHKGYHINIAHLILEAVKEGEHVAHGESGDVLITGLYNYAMPLIRFELDDVVVTKEDPCSCGRGLPLLEKIEGRSDAFIILPSGRILSPLVLTDVFAPYSLGLLDSSFSFCKYIQQFKIIQHIKSNIEIQLVPGEYFFPAIQDQIKAQLTR
ncbi:MAG: phenylacetate--CoA ligase family protein, partial [Candidatus Hodarchaeota archaeon]